MWCRLTWCRCGPVWNCTVQVHNVLRRVGLAGACWGPVVNTNRRAMDSCLISRSLRRQLNWHACSLSACCCQRCQRCFCPRYRAAAANHTCCPGDGSACNACKQAQGQLLLEPHPARRLKRFAAGCKGQDKVQVIVSRYQRTVEAIWGLQAACLGNGRVQQPNGQHLVPLTGCNAMKAPVTFVCTHFWLL